MKKTYSAPAIKVSKIDTESLMTTASITSIGGETGSKIGTGDKPTTGSFGRAKSYNVWDDVDVDDEE